MTDRQFTGQVNDGATGLYYYNARYYDPTLHRFIQADTIVPDPSDPQTLNRYAYTLNNPVKYTDPTGHKVDDGGGGGCGTAGEVCVDDPSDLTPASLKNNPRCQKIGMPACIAELALTTAGSFAAATLVEGTVLGGAAANGVAAAGTAIWNAEVALAEGLRQGAQAAGTFALQFIQRVVGSPSANPITADGDGGTTEAQGIVQASQAAFDAAKNVFVKPKHMPGAGGNWARFSSGVDPNAIVRQALQSPNAQFSADPKLDRFIVFTEMGQVVGDKGQTAVKAVVSWAGDLITAYPGR